MRRVWWNRNRSETIRDYVQALVFVLCQRGPRQGRQAASPRHRPAPATRTHCFTVPAPPRADVAVGTSTMRPGPRHVEPSGWRSSSTHSRLPAAIAMRSPNVSRMELARGSVRARSRAVAAPPPRSRGASLRSSGAGGVAARSAGASASSPGLEPGVAETPFSGPERAPARAGASLGLGAAGRDGCHTSADWVRSRAGDAGMRRSETRSPGLGFSARMRAPPFRSQNAAR